MTFTTYDGNDRTPYAANDGRSGAAPDQFRTAGHHTVARSRPAGTPRPGRGVSHLTSSPAGPGTPAPGPSHPAAAGLRGILQRRRGDLLAAAALVLLPLALGAVVGGAGLGQADPTAAPVTELSTLLGHNLVMAAVAASGLLTFGVGTVLAVVPSWFLVGTQVGAAWSLRGAAGTISGLAHAPVELAGFVVATALGLLPASRIVGQLRRGAAEPLSRVARDALGLLVLAVALVSLAAVLETSLTPVLITP